MEFPVTMITGRAIHGSDGKIPVSDLYLTQNRAQADAMKKQLQQCGHSVRVVRRVVRVFGAHVDLYCVAGFKSPEKTI